MTDLQNSYWNSFTLHAKQKQQNHSNMLKLKVNALSNFSYFIVAFLFKWLYDSLVWFPIFVKHFCAKAWLTWPLLKLAAWRSNIYTQQQQCEETEWLTRGWSCGWCLVWRGRVRGTSGLACCCSGPAVSLRQPRLAAAAMWEEFGYPQTGSGHPEDPSPSGTTTSDRITN